MLKSLTAFSILGRIGGDATQEMSESFATDERTFSILGRIGGDATRIDGECLFLHGLFQYPRSDRRRCNLGGAWRKSGRNWSFQYPRSDRRRCNMRQKSIASCCHSSFSILGRIGGDATGENGKEQRALVWTFSILGRIGGDATCGGGGGDAVTLCELSVSSVGSEAMQRCAYRTSGLGI